MLLCKFWWRSLLLLLLKRLASSWESRRADKSEEIIYDDSAFLHDASRRRVEEEAVKLWLKNLEEVAYVADNLLDEFNYEIIRRKVELRNQMQRKVCFFFCFTNPVLFRSKIAHKIKVVNMKLKMVNEEAISYGLQSRVLDSAILVPSVLETDSLSVEPSVLGRENDASEIVNMLVNSSDEVVSVLPVVGMGGIGKTTLARLVFNDQQIDRCFNSKAWFALLKILVPPRDFLRESLNH
ncbi:UNVERIFIED_CONTAM: Disease resistance protein RGA2 [Sesamum latifolium]|uniref:Disease resistance protein RGA2 n=1 Tax=Sesamum latifolium TaxID=2727402 RepID=A0AAW2XUD4_9LAMI